jgi:hypothetical protein
MSRPTTLLQKSLIEMPDSPAHLTAPASDVDDAALERVMRDVPRGALALSGLTVGLLLLA